MRLQRGEGGGCWILGKFRMDDWGLLGSGRAKGFCAAGGQQQDCVLAPGSEEGAPGPLTLGFMDPGSLRLLEERSAWCLHKHRADLPGGSVIRIMLSAVTHLELLSGLLVEGREGCDVKKGSITVCSLG